METLQHKPLDITSEQRDNLITLAKGLLTIDVPGVKFDMNHFTDRSGSGHTDCGTSGCAVGWAPFFGIKKNADEDWDRFCHRAFGIWIFLSSGEFLFSSNWDEVDNTKTGAAQRIIYALIHGVPYDSWVITDEQDLFPLYQHLTLADLEAWEAAQKGGGE